MFSIVDMFILGPNYMKESPISVDLRSGIPDLGTGGKVGCVPDFQVLQVNRLFAITYSVHYAFSIIAGYRFHNFL